MQKGKEIRIQRGKVDEGNKKENTKNKSRRINHKERKQTKEVKQKSRK